MKTSGTAVAAAILGGLGMFCLPVVGGLFGLILGVSARQEIHRSEGTKSGIALANLGIGLGILQLVLGVAGIGIGIAQLANRSSPTPPPPPTVAVLPPPSPTGLSTLPAPPPSGAKAPAAPPSSKRSANATIDESVIETKIGGLTLVDIGRDATPLRDELERQRVAAERANEKLVLWTVQRDCEPCNGVAAALPDTQMQTALAGVRLVRVDVHEHSFELTHLGIPTKVIPGFALLGSRVRPVDYLHGGEWDEDVARNIAPVMEKFIQGKYRKRRHPWRRADETPI